MSERDIIADARHALAAWNRHQKDPDFDGPHEHHLVDLVERFIRELEAERVEHIVQRDLARFAVRVLDRCLANWAECIEHPDLGTDPDALRDVTLGQADEVERLRDRAAAWEKRGDAYKTAAIRSTHARDKLVEAEQAIGRVRDLHRVDCPCGSDRDGSHTGPDCDPICAECLEWPCDTLDAFDGAEGAPFPTERSAAAAITAILAALPDDELPAPDRIEALPDGERLARFGGMGMVIGSAHRGGEPAPALRVVAGVREAMIGERMRRLDLAHLNDAAGDR